MFNLQSIFVFHCPYLLIILSKSLYPYLFHSFLLHIVRILHFLSVHSIPIQIEVTRSSPVNDHSYFELSPAIRLILSPALPFVSSVPEFYQIRYLCHSYLIDSSSCDIITLCKTIFSFIFISTILAF